MEHGLNTNGTDLSPNSLVFQKKGLPGHDEGLPNSLRWQGGLQCHILTGNGVPAKSVLLFASLHRVQGCRLLLCFPKTRSSKCSGKKTFPGANAFTRRWSRCGFFCRRSLIRIIPCGKPWRVSSPIACATASNPARLTPAPMPRRVNVCPNVYSHA